MRVWPGLATLTLSAFPAKVQPLSFGDGLVGSFPGGHGDKSNPLERPLSRSFTKSTKSDFAFLGEQGLDLFLGGGFRQVAYGYPDIHCCFLLRRSP